jgi:hypothetical protein
MSLKKSVLYLILAFSLMTPLMAVAGRYQDFRSPEHPPYGSGDPQYRAVLLIEKIKNEQKKRSPRMAALRTMLEIELDALEDLADLRIVDFSNTIKAKQERLKVAPTEEERASLVESIATYQNALGNAEKSLKSVKELRKYTRPQRCK